MDSFEVTTSTAGLIARCVQGDQLEVTLYDDNIRGLVTIDSHYASGFLPLSTWATGLATDWRGWSGMRVYESVNHDFTIAAVHTGSHVRLDVDLRGSVAVDAWRMHVTLTIDAGEQLTEFARAVSSVCGMPSPN